MLKRTIDITVAVLALLVFAPVLAASAVAILFTMGRPILFKQARPGLHGRPFTMYKFRTMRDEPADGSVLPDADRLTRLGDFLRSTSIDELPELINVLKGDMSLVGPRPLLLEYLPLYTSEQARRHEVRPGITGWAQVNGRNSMRWERKFELDVWYVDHQSTLLDLKILILTVARVFARDGVRQPGQATAEKFRGE